MDQRQRGIIKSWRDEKGFGFICPTSGGPDIFFHVTSVTNSRRRDLVGQRVTYVQQPGQDGKFSAVDVRLAVSSDDVRPPPARSRPGLKFAWAFSLVFVVAVAALSIGYKSAYVPVVYVAVSAITYSTYRRDKNSALAGYWRIPESTLHLMELLGGWPGALVAQWRIPHKNRKASYQVVFWFIVILHLAVAAFMAIQYAGSP